MRTFIALDFNKDLKDRLGKVQRILKNNSTKGRWVYVDNFHLTLKFLGNVHINNINEIKTALGDIAKENNKIHLSLDDLGFFPGKDNLRVVWLGIKGDTQLLQNIHSKVDRSMKNLGYPKERRKFKPHITLGRNIIFDTTIYKLKDKLKLDLDYSFTLEKIQLLKSEEVDGKRIYTSLGSYKLKEKKL